MEITKTAVSRFLFNSSHRFNLIIHSLLLYFLLTISISVFASDAKPLEIKPLEIKKLQRGVYLHSSFKYTAGYGLVDSNGLIVVDKGQAYIIDTPWTEEDTARLLAWTKQKGFKLKASISTHFHEDRTAGIKLLNENSVSTYTSELSKKILEHEGKTTPTHAFKGKDFVLGDGLIEFYYPGAGHTEDNIVAWLPKSQILFGGCLVRTQEWDNLGYLGDAAVGSWAQSIRNIKSKNYAIKTIVPGHGKVGTSDILDHTLNLAESVVKK